MTIYTTENTANQEKKDLVPELDVVVTEHKPLSEGNVHADDGDYPVPVYRPPTDRRRNRRLGLQICLFMGMILGLCVCVMGSVYLYKSTTSKQKYQGWCGVKYQPSESSEYVYLDEDVYVEDDIVLVSVPNRYNSMVGFINDTLRKYNEKTTTKSTPTAPAVSDNATAANVDIDWVRNQVAINHDFTSKMTTIFDKYDGVCYVMPLDTEKIPEPQTFLDLLVTIMSESSIPEASEVRKEYKVVLPPVSNDDIFYEFGYSTFNLCEGVETYKLVEIDPAKRTTTMATELDPDYWFMREYEMFAGGDNVFKYVLH